MPDLTFISLEASAIRSVRDELAALRMIVFRSFPYLYDGDEAYERTYLETYIRSDRSLLFAVMDDDRMVGATTALPLSDETVEVQAPFNLAGYDLEQLFYFGESVLLPEYRGYGLGNRFFDEREAHARRFGTYSTACFCAVQRPDDHLMRPADYRPLDAFWAKRGYTARPDLLTTFAWPDWGETESTEKTMMYWTRSL
jgi:GNAT superfamily N-acetyltransferase